MITIVKLGGAAITDKNKENTLRREVIDSTIGELADCDDLIIVHGAGSFGHIVARKYLLRYGRNNEIDLDKQLDGIVKVKSNLKILDETISIACQENGIRAITFHPSSFMYSNGEDLEQVVLTHVFKAMSLGMIPVIGGDLVFDETTGFRIVSGDRLIKIICEHLVRGGEKVRVIFGSSTDGVYDKDPKHDDATLLKNINRDQLRELLSKPGESAGIDVTGGMRSKLIEINKLVELGIKVWVVNITIPERLLAVLDGKPVVCSLFDLQ